MVKRRGKAWHIKRKCEAMRLSKELIGSGWESKDSKDLSLRDRVERAADIWLGHTQGCVNRSLRSRRPDNEILLENATHIDLVSPVVYMTP